MPVVTKERAAQVREVIEAERVSLRHPGRHTPCPCLFCANLGCDRNHELAAVVLEQRQPELTALQSAVTPPQQGALF